jgi:hypothetical protein
LIPSLTHKHEWQRKNYNLLITNHFKPINTLAAQEQVLKYVMAFASLSIILSKNVAP